MSIENQIRIQARFLAEQFITATTLAEEIAFVLDHPEWLDDPNHPLWEITAKEFYHE